MANTNYDRTIAFAGICQAVALVQKVAQTGNCDSAAFETSISSIINMNLPILWQCSVMSVSLSLVLRPYHATSIAQQQAMT
ncbi:hypothetical protein JCM19231_1008 [Vibrio ishigakensis]|uniref:Uncharacterized protein n=1 Tax=Vibrio ishigakensis TaxID=1481914 RepID=A0A0B8NQY6_9VIBR|nr:hypothetical protein JCM19231_1008 [Vibrio ishigakensis]